MAQQQPEPTWKFNKTVMNIFKIEALMELDDYLNPYDTIKVTVNLENKSNKEEIIEKIKSKFEKLKEVKSKYVCEMIEIIENENEVIIYCEFDFFNNFVYDYTVSKYHNENNCLITEIGSQVFDLIQIYNVCHGLRKDNIPVYFTPENETCMLKKDISLPFPILCLTPLAFLIPIVDEQYERPIIKSMNECFKTINTNITDNKIEMTPIINMLENGVDDDIQRINEMELVKEFVKLRKLNPFSMNDISIPKYIAHSAHGMIFSCLYKEKPGYCLKVCGHHEIETLKKECFIMSCCDHPNIITVEGFVESNYQLVKEMKKELVGKIGQDKYEEFIEEEGQTVGYMLMEFVEGKSLFDYVEEYTKEERCLDGREIRVIFGQIVSACKYLYQEKRMIHRDIKPENVLLKVIEGMDYPNVKVCDFGFSRNYCNAMVTIAGTPCDADIKICEGKAYGPKSDLFSLGCLLYFLRHGKRAFNGRNLNELNQMKKNLNIDFREGEDDVELAKLLEKLLAPEEERRINWEEFLETTFVKECFDYVKEAFEN